ncbi:MAG: YetF domain-containing protein [Thermomicrobiales bacterium]
MFDLGTEWWQIIVRSTAVYMFILLALRVTGWRSLGQRNALDLVLILVVANAVQNAMIGPDTSLIGGMIAASTLFAVDQVLDRIRGQSRAAHNFFGDTPTVLVNNGQVVDQAMHRTGVSWDELEEIMREHGFDRLGQVKTAVLEMDGSISIVPASAQVTRSHRRVKPRRRSSIERNP